MPAGFGSNLSLTDCAQQGATCGSISRYFGKQIVQGFWRYREYAAWNSCHQPYEQKGVAKD
jgi:hypothetical protein